MPIRILIIGGTGLARQLAETLTGLGCEVVLSLAGVTSTPCLPGVGVELRVGGFGGDEGLVRYIAQSQISVVVDATHPFAVTMGEQAYKAAHAAKIPCYRLAHPPWQAMADDDWHVVKNFAEGAALLPSGAVVFLSIGHKGLVHFIERTDITGVIRLIEPLAKALPSALATRWQVILARGPFTLDSEIALFQQHHISHLVAKNSGSVETAAKLDAARALGLHVVMIERPRRADIPVYNIEQMVAQVEPLARA